MRAARPGRKADGLVAVLSINFNPTNCLEFISRGASETARSRGKQRNNAGEEKQRRVFDDAAGCVVCVVNCCFASSR